MKIPTPAERARKLRYHHRVHDSLLPAATNLWSPWTTAEIALALDYSRTARDIAKQLRRTTGGVQGVRSSYRKAKAAVAAFRADYPEAVSALSALDTLIRGCRK